MEVIRTINTDIMPIQINKVDMARLSIDKYNAIDINTSVNAHNLVPFFEMHIKSKEYELGLKRNLWSSEQLKKIEDEFASKYLT